MKEKERGKMHIICSCFVEFIIFRIAILFYFRSYCLIYDYYSLFAICVNFFVSYILGNE